MKSLSICIQTYHRSVYLNNCLKSIKSAKKNSNLKFDVCIADNNENNLNKTIINKYKKFLKIKYYKNKKNIGRSKNMLKAVSLSKSDYIWLVGDDDLVLTNAIIKIINIINKKEIDFL